MDENYIRQEVRDTLQELMQKSHPSYYTNASSNKFPYQSDDDIVRLPEDIDTQEEYLVNWNHASSNQDIQDFPSEEFKKGIAIEKTKREFVNILDVAKIVIDNLKENPLFYSNLGV